LILSGSKNHGFKKINVILKNMKGYLTPVKDGKDPLCLGDCNGMVIGMRFEKFIYFRFAGLNIKDVFRVPRSEYEIRHAEN
jgi:hypothetical protein